VTGTACPFEARFQAQSVARLASGRGMIMMTRVLATPAYQAGLPMAA
jgi:hypothetical protein